jgi:hypothetical protein
MLGVTMSLLEVKQMNTPWIKWPLVAGGMLATVGAAMTAQAECKPLPYGSSSTDEDFSSRVCKKGDYAGFETLGLYYWNRFGFHKDQGWSNTNYGFDNYCDPRKPLGRTLNAFYLLQNSYTPKATDWNDTSGPWVKSMYGYVAGGYNGLDDLRAGKCGGEYAARAQHGFFQDDYIILYQETFQANVMFRAGTLVHENWHYRTGRSHACNDGNDDTYFYQDYMIFVQEGQGRAVVNKWVVNPSADELATYAAEGMWYLDYYANANLNTKSSLFEAALKYFQDRIGDHICDQDSIPSDIRDLL